MTSLSLFAVDAHGSHADLGDSSTPTWLLVVLAIIVTVFGIPFAVASLNSRDKDDKKSGCFYIVGIIPSQRLFKLTTWLSTQNKYTE